MADFVADFRAYETDNKYHSSDYDDGHNDPQIQHRKAYLDSQCINARRDCQKQQGWKIEKVRSLVIQLKRTTLLHHFDTDKNKKPERNPVIVFLDVCAQCHSRGPDD